MHRGPKHTKAGVPTLAAIAAAGCAWQGIALAQDQAPTTRPAVVTAASHTVRPDDWIFEYHIESAASTVWWHVGQPD